MLTGPEAVAAAGRGRQPLGRAEVPARAGAGRGRVPSRRWSATSRPRSDRASRCSPCRASSTWPSRRSPATWRRSSPPCRRRPACPTRRRASTRSTSARRRDRQPAAAARGRHRRGRDPRGRYRGGQRISDGIPTMLEGVPLPISKIEITVDREGFFLNPTGCDPRTLIGDLHVACGGQTATSSMQLAGDGLRQAAVRPDAPHDRGRARQDERRPERAPAADRDRDAEGRRGGDLQGARPAARHPAAERAVPERAGRALQRRPGRRRAPARRSRWSAARA